MKMKKVSTAERLSDLESGYPARRLVKKFENASSAQESAHSLAVIFHPWISGQFDSLVPTRLIRRFSQTASPSELPCGSLSRPSPRSRFALRAAVADYRAAAQSTDCC
jgi:hypothetical protein